MMQTDGFQWNMCACDNLGLFPILFISRCLILPFFLLYLKNSDSYKERKMKFTKD